MRAKNQSIQSWTRAHTHPAHKERKGPTRQIPEPSTARGYIRTLAHAQPPHDRTLCTSIYANTRCQTTCSCSHTHSPTNPRRLRSSSDPLSRSSTDSENPTARRPAPICPPLLSSRCPPPRAPPRTPRRAGAEVVPVHDVRYGIAMCGVTVRCM